MKISPRLSAQLEAVFESDTLDWNELILSIDEDPETFLAYSNLSFIDFSHTDMRNMSIVGSYIDGIKVTKGRLTEQQISTAASALDIIWLEPMQLDTQAISIAESKTIILVDFHRAHNAGTSRNSLVAVEWPIAALSGEDLHLQIPSREPKTYSKFHSDPLVTAAVLASVDTDIGLIKFIMKGNSVQVRSTVLQDSVLEIDGQQCLLEKASDSADTFTVLGVTPMLIRALLQKAHVKNKT